MSRWIAISVEMMDHPVVGMQVPPPKAADPEKHAQSPMVAWMDLIASAAWRSKDVAHKNAVVTLKRGEFLAGRAYWANRWNWGEQSVRSFFSRLASFGMIEKSNQSNGHLANVVTICNYEKYQSKALGGKPDEKPEPNQSLTSAQPEGNQTVPGYTKVTSITKVTSNSPTVEKHAAREDAGERAELPVMLDSTAEIVGWVARSLNHIAPDFMAAKAIVKSNMGIYGANVVQDSYAELMADIASGKVRVGSLKTLVGYCQRSREKAVERPRMSPATQPPAGGLGAVLARLKAQETAGAA